MQNRLKRFVTDLPPGVLATFDRAKNLLLINGPFYLKASTQEQERLWRCETTIELADAKSG